MGRVITLAGATPDKMRVVAVVLSGLKALGVRNLNSIALVARLWVWVGRDAYRKPRQRTPAPLSPDSWLAHL